MIKQKSHFQLTLCNIIIIIIKKQNKQMSSDDQTILTHTKKLGNGQFQVYCKSQPEIAHWIFSIQKYLRKVPSFYYTSLLILNKGRSIQTIEKRLKQQFEKLTSQKSFYNTIHKALASRQKCIQKIKRDLIKAERVLKLFKKQYMRQDNINHFTYLEYVQQQGYFNIHVDETIQSSIQIISSIFIDMSRLRDMTIYVVETIHKWKVQVQQWADKCNQYEPVFFLHEKNSAYDIILQDNKFIWQSSLEQYIFLNCKNDPFLIRNVMLVQQRQPKTILQKYFVQILYPKNQQIVSKALKCYQMLNFKFQPQIKNIYRQEQLLIQNYLSLKQNQQNEEGAEQINQNQFQWQEHMKKQKKIKLNAKGWVFGKTLKKPSTQKVKQIIERHNNKITFIKPFNIANYDQKKSLALAYLSQAKQQSIQQSRVKPLIQKLSENKKSQQIFKIYRTRSTHQLKRNSNNNNEPLLTKAQKGYRSQNQSQTSKKLSKMYQSLSKLNPIIMEDPRQHNAQTPFQNKRRIQILNKDNTQTQPQSQFKQKEKYKQYETQNQLGYQSHLVKKNFKLKVNTFDSNKTQEQLAQKQLINAKQLNFPTQNKEKQIKTENNRITEKKQMPQNQIIVQNVDPQKQQQNLNKRQQHQIKGTDRKLQNSINKDRSLEKINVSTQQEQIDFGQFLQNFRHDTNKIPKKVVNKDAQKVEQKKKRIQQNKKKLVGIRQLIQNNKYRYQRINSINKRSRIISDKISSKYSPYLMSKGKYVSPEKNNKINGSIQSNKSQKLQKSFVQYNKIQPLVQRKNSQKFRFDDGDFIILHSKSIPIDVIPAYLRHIFSQIHSTSKKFTLYTYEDLLKKLQDPYVHSVIFDISTQKKGHIGQVVLSQTLGVNNQRLKYTIEFINIHLFQYVVASVLRIAEQLLYATPCQQVICPLMQDKLDPVSVHFIDLIQNAFKARVQLFGCLTILQKKRTYYKQTDLYERLYIFSSNNKRLQQLKISKAMMGNYRSLKFESKCLLLSSNFRMRSKSSTKNTITNYQNISIGYLYRKVFQKILTKYHLRQMKVASVSPNQADQTASLIKENSFLRTSMTALAQFLKQDLINQDDYIHLTRFQNMSEVLTYLEYKQYSQNFHFNFLQQSRFILNHELLISQFEMDLSLQFMVRSSVQFLILYNHHNLPIKIIQANQTNKAKAAILPTTNDEIELIFINGTQYVLETTDKLDLFSYIYIYQQHIKSYKIVNDVKQIVIPTIHKNTKSLNSVKMFDGLFRLFPERQFYSGTYLKSINLWQSYFPSAVVYKPELNSIVFQYPLIVGFLHKKKKQILTAFLLKENME